MALLPLPAAAQLATDARYDASLCNVQYHFDGDLNDAGGNGYHGALFGPERAGATPGFVDGVMGQALELDGTAVMEVELSLNAELCPQFTISGWVRTDPSVSAPQWLVSTGSGGTPGLRTSSATAVLSGSGNGLWERDAVRDSRAWFFFAGVFDYGAGSYRFYWRERTYEGKLANRSPDDLLWVGAYNGKLASPTRNGAIDELRIIGRALAADEIAQLRRGLPSALVRASGTGAGGSSRAIPQAAPGVTDRLASTKPIVDAQDLADRRSTVPVLPGAADGSDSADSSDQSTSVGLIDADPAIVDGQRSPLADVTAPHDDFATELEENLEQIRENPQIEKVDEILCDSKVAPVIDIDSNAAYPERFMNALNQLVECGFTPQVVAINHSDQWFVSGGDQIARSTNIPAELAQQLDDFENTHGALDAGDISNAGSWLLSAGGEFTQSGLDPRVRLYAMQITSGGGRILSFSFDPDQPEDWLMVDDAGEVYSKRRIPEIDAAVAQFPLSQIVPRQARYLDGGSWVLFGNDHWYISDNLPLATLTSINALRDANKGIVQYLSYKSRGDFLSITTSAPPARSSDPLWIVENRFADNKNIWTRLQESDITGAAIALVWGDSVAWSRGYGLRMVTDKESFVHPDTRFDFASVSKPVSAFALMQLDEDPDGDLDIEETGGLEAIEALFSGDDLETFRNNVQPERGNVAQVMQHCAGLCYGLAENCDDKFKQSGAQVYSDDRAPPTTAEVILGKSPAVNNKRVLRNGRIGDKSRYTSANYALIQALIDVHGGGFVAHTNALFRDLDMHQSTFASPYLDRNGPKFARGHEKGQMMDIHAYGELAAASRRYRPFRRCRQRRRRGCPVQ